jgi:hypothetical protein
MKDYSNVWYKKSYFIIKAIDNAVAKLWSLVNSMRLYCRDPECKLPPPPPGQWLASSKKGFNYYNVRGLKNFIPL